MDRPDWDSYYMGIAKAVATRGTCSRLQVGAVIVRGHAVIATGYNGSLPGWPHCDEVDPPHLLEHGHCTMAVHAEANAVAQAARRGSCVSSGSEEVTIYTTASPCANCFKLIASAGITRVVAGVLYRDARVLQWAKMSHVQLEVMADAT